MQQLYCKKPEGSYEKKDVYTVVTGRILDLLEQGIVPWKPCTKNNGSVQPPLNGYSGHQYQGINVLVLIGEQLAQGYASNRWLTMKQVNTLGGRVQRGQRGTPIVFARYIDRKENGKVVLDKDGNPEQRYFLTYTYGWNVEQTTITLEEEAISDQLDPALRQSQANDFLLSYIEREGIETTNVGDRAYYQPKEDLINLPDFSRALSPARWFESAFHESIHSTGHLKRLGRLEDWKARSWGDANYAKEELVAELGAAYLMAEYGIFEEQEQNLAEYIRHWIGVLQGNKTLIFQASSKAQTAVAYMKSEVTA